jgi:hypothetical protein
MIYEYPNDFIVPVVFGEDLFQKGKESIREWNLPCKKQELLKNQFEEPIYKYNMADEIPENDNMKSILNDIDEDYAVSQTLRV